MDNNSNKADMPISAGINIQMQQENNIARYIQTGIMSDKGFTGLVTDYAGGGQYQDFYFLDGEELPDDDMDMSTIEHTLEEAAPGIIDAIYALRDEYLTIDEVDWIYYANEKLRDVLPTLDRNKLFSAGADITPITCSAGMTIFPDSPSYIGFDMATAE